MILYYKDVLNEKLKGQTEIFKEIDVNILDNSIEEINRRINVLLDLKKKYI